jgi:TM2 domain-containing membrane protein YozV
MSENNQNTERDVEGATVEQNSSAQESQPQPQQAQQPQPQQPQQAQPQPQQPQQPQPQPQPYYEVPPQGQAPYQDPAQPQQQNPYQSQGQPQSPYYQQPYAQQTTASKDHIAAGLLGIFLGSLGIHKFYLGYNTSGFIMLGVTILGSILTFGIAAGAVGIIGIIEGIIYLTKSQEEFNQTYVYNRHEWF